MSKRHAIIEIHCAGVSNSMIIKQSFDNDKDRPKSGRLRTARTSKIIKKARERVRRNPK